MAFSQFPDTTALAWTTYSPSWTAVSSNPTLGNGTITGRYLRTGKTLDVHIDLTTGSTTTYGTGGYYLSLPSGLTAVTASGARQIGSVWLFDSSATANYAGICRIDSAETRFLINAGGTTGNVSGTVPFTWATSDEIHLNARIEIA